MEEFGALKNIKMEDYKYKKAKKKGKLQEIKSLKKLLLTS